MSTPHSSLAIEIEPLISYPKKAEAGKSYVMTVDLRQRVTGAEWPYDAEEYAIYCMLDTGPLFSSEPVGDHCVVLHRFGGTYGPAMFILTAAEKEMRGNMRLSLISESGMPVDVIEIPGIQITKEQIKSRTSDVSFVRESTVSTHAAHHQVQHTAAPKVADPVPGAPPGFRIRHTLKLAPSRQPAGEITWSPDGKILLVPSDNVQFWDADTGQLLRTLRTVRQKPDETIGDVIYSPNGALLAVVDSHNHLIEIWNTKTWSKLRVLTDHEGLITSLAWSPDGRILASTSADDIKLWEVTSGRLQRSHTEKRGSPRIAAWSPDGQRLACGNSDNSIRIWAGTEFSLHKTLEGHTEGVYSLAWSPDGKILASGGKDHAIRIWDMTTGDCKFTLNKHDNYVIRLSFSADNRLLASKSSDGMMMLWRCDNWEWLATFDEHSVGAWASSPAFHPTQHVLATLGEEHKVVHIWDLDLDTLLAEPDPIPRDFREEVELATQNKELGDLELLSAEARGFEWEIEGLRLVGRAQFNLKAFEGARATWEALRKQDSLDVEANTLLGTIYQRLGDLTSSDPALKRVLSRSGLEKENRAEVSSLLGRNAKSQWTEDWKHASSLEDRQRRALVSPYLDESIEAYDAAFKEDLNHFYSGLNTLAMLTIQTKLAELMPDVWAERFEDDDSAARELNSRNRQVQKLSASVGLSLKATAERLNRERRTDVWAEISDADLCFLTSNKPAKVLIAYRKALADAPAFMSDAVRRQLSIYLDLGLFEENVNAVLSVLEPEAAPATAPVATAPKHVLLFTGHMIDAPGRAQPRFAPDKAEIAKQKIAEAVAAEQQVAGGIAYGIAGCASGGDILFHQVCETMNIPTRIFLAVPRELYVRASVAQAGPQWVEEFNRLVRSHPVRVLCASEELPRWLQGKPDYNIWQRNNLWELHNALAAAGGENVTLIALWNGASGDGAGGTADMVQKAQERGAKTIILDTNKIFAE